MDHWWLACEISRTQIRFRIRTHWSIALQHCIAALSCSIALQHCIALRSDFGFRFGVWVTGDAPLTPCMHLQLLLYVRSETLTFVTFVTGPQRKALKQSHHFWGDSLLLDVPSKNHICLANLHFAADLWQKLELEIHPWIWTLRSHYVFHCFEPRVPKKH